MEKTQKIEKRREKARSLAARPKVVVWVVFIVFVWFCVCGGAWGEDGKLKTTCEYLERGTP